MSDFIDVNVKNPATGSTDLGSSTNETEDKIKKLLSKIEKPSDDEISLSSLNSVIGLPVESNIELKNLVNPPKDWINIFSKATESDIQKMAASIYQYGLLHRVTLWQQEENRFVILGGMTRVAAFNYLYEITANKKWSSIPAKIYSANQLDEIDAKRIFIVSNTDQRQMSTKNISFAYYNLIKLEKQRSFYGSGIFSRDAAAKQANVSPTTFNNYLKLIELYPPLVDEIDAGNLQMMSAYEIAFLEKNLQKYIYDKKYFVGLNRKTAKILKEKATTVEDVEKIIDESKKTETTFKYQIISKEKLTSDNEILPIFVNKNYKAEILKIFEDAISKSDLPQEIKVDLLKNFS